MNKIKIFTLLITLTMQNFSKSQSDIQRPKVGVGVIIINNSTVLLGKRKNAHGEGYWAPPGGHLEFGETVEQCAKREALEETNLTLNNIKIGPYTNDNFLRENKHYITLFVFAESEGQVKLMEPEKCEEWQWFDINNLPSPLFLPVDNLQKQYGPLEKLVNNFLIK